MCEREKNSPFSSCAFSNEHGISLYVEKHTLIIIFTVYNDTTFIFNLDEKRIAKKSAFSQKYF